MTSDPPGPTPAEGPDPYGNPDPEWLRVDWPGRIRQVDVGGTRVNYAELGSGPETLLLLHGLAGSWQNWLEQAPQFARTHRVVALDLPGFGPLRCRRGTSRSRPMATWSSTSARRWGSSG